MAVARDSSLELFRIVLMLMIISCHYVVNSGLSKQILEECAGGQMSWRGLSLLMFGAWGKVAINCFLLITGYFMCTGRATAGKFLKLYLQIVFYNVAIGVIFLAFGHEAFSTSTICYWFWPFKNLTTGFTSAFLAFFLFVPYVNGLIRILDQRKHLQLLLALLFVFSLLPTLPFACISVANNYVSWFIIVYLVGAYIRRYPLMIFERRGYMAGFAGVAFVMGTLSVAVMTNFLPQLANIGLSWVYYWLWDSEKITALIAAVAFFLFFRSLKLPYIKAINVVASATFGVLLIHAKSDAMRHWLWQDVCQNVECYLSGGGVARAMIVVFCIYGACVVLELLRQRFFSMFSNLIYRK